MMRNGIHVRAVSRLWSLNQWLSSRLQYLQCLLIGDTIVFALSLQNLIMFYDAGKVFTQYFGRLPMQPHSMGHRQHLNPWRPRQNGRHFADDIFKHIFVNENARISIKFSLKFVPKGPIHNIPALVQIMAWRRPGDKPLSEPVLVSLLTHICVTRPQ